MQCKHQSIGLQKKTRAHVQNHPYATVSAKIAFVLGFLVHNMEFVKFDRNVFLMDCLLPKNKNLAKMNAHKPLEWFVLALPSDRLLDFSIGYISVFRVSGRNTYTPEVLKNHSDGLCAFCNAHLRHILWVFYT